MSILSKVYKLLRERPLEIWPRFREWAMMQWAYRTRSFFHNNPNIHFGENVRVQRNGSLLVQRPHASLSIGDHTILWEHANIQILGDGKLSIGSHCVVTDVHFYCLKEISIGDGCGFGPGTLIYDYDPHPVDPKLRAVHIREMVLNHRPRFDTTATIPEFTEFDQDESPVIIGNAVWICANVTILKGVEIGDGCVVACGAVVTRGKYPPNSLIAGNPAKVIKSL